jgi:hydrogenase nickel incorporation protein HypA/HybF
MHELSIAQSIIEIVEDNIRPIRIKKVKSVTVKVGRMSNVLPDSLIFGFDSLIIGTSLEGAELIIEDIPVKIKCRKCLNDTEIEHMNFICASCGSTDFEMLSGRELSVGEIEVEEEN